MLLIIKNIKLIKIKLNKTVVICIFLFNIVIILKKYNILKHFINLLTSVIYSIFFLILFNTNTFSTIKNSTTVINADRLNAEKNRTKFSATGNVQLTRDKYKVTADEVIYDNLENKIYLKSRTKLKDIEGNNIFADEGVISKDMIYGEFKNAGIILKNGISIVSPNIIKENDDKYSIEQSNYYFCPNSNLNIDLPYNEIIKEIKKNKVQLFSIYSKKSAIDKEKNKIYLNHVFIRFLEIPFFYLPYISTSRPFTKNISGFSSPTIKHSSNYGYSISVPYKFYTKNDSTFLIKPEIFSDKNFIIGIGFKLNENKNTYFNIDLDYIFDNHKSKYFLNDSNVSEIDEGKYNNNRFKFNLELNGIYNNDLFYKSNINFINNRYLLRDYYGNNKTILESNFDLIKIKTNGYWNFDIVSFQEIRDEITKRNFEQIHSVPSLEYVYRNRFYSKNNNQLKFNIAINTREIINDNNSGYTNLNILPTLNYKKNISGIFLETNISFNANSYNYFNHSYNNDDDIYRIIPEFEIKFEIPYFLFNNILIKPKVQYFISDSNDNGKINVDSYDSELTINNIFTSNRYSGYDLVEEGSRINYGLETSLYTDYGNFNFMIAQGYRDKIDKNNQIINFEKHLSNIITYFYYNYKNTFIGFMDTIDNQNYNHKRKELMIESLIDNLQFAVSFVDLNNYSEKYLKYKKEKQLNFNFSYKFTRYLFVDFELDNDLYNKTITTFKTALRYEDECFRIQASIKKTDYVDSAEGANTSFDLSLRLKGGQW